MRSIYHKPVSWEFENDAPQSRPLDAIKDCQTAPEISLPWSGGKLDTEWSPQMQQVCRPYAFVHCGIVRIHPVRAATPYAGH